MWPVNLPALLGTATRCINTHTRADALAQCNQLSHSVCLCVCDEEWDCACICANACVCLRGVRWDSLLGPVKPWRHHMVSVSLTDHSVLLHHLSPFIFLFPRWLFSSTTLLWSRGFLPPPSCSPLFPPFVTIFSASHTHTRSPFSCLQPFLACTYFICSIICHC